MMVTKSSTDKKLDKKAPRFQKMGGKADQGGTVTMTDNRPATVFQRKLQAGMHAHSSQNTFPIQPKPNHTGLPNNLKSGIENLSGFAMDDVKVHYNSSKPAQLKAHAYAQGSDIHLAPGQEKHLPHEAWHVVQQKQGRVQPTRQLKSKVAINDDAGLEKEADVMGERALQSSGLGQNGLSQATPSSMTVQRFIITKDYEEDEDTMEPLMGFVAKKQRVYLAEQDGRLKKDNKNHPISKVIGAKRFTILDELNNPTGIPPGDYNLLHYKDAVIRREAGEDVFRAEDQYVLVEKNQVQARAQYQNISNIPHDPNNLKQGKIVPGVDDPEISHHDVYQSGISDCYLHAALISIVHADPAAIRNLFRFNGNDVIVTFPGKPDYNSIKNTYENKPWEVKMSRKLFLKPDGSPLYGGKKNAYLWPAFLQKAWAIYKGNYANLEMGVSHNLMETILGRRASNQVMAFTKAWDLYDNIKAGLDAGKSVTLGTTSWSEKKFGFKGSRPFYEFKSKMPQKSKNSLGIMHAYAILRSTEDNSTTRTSAPKAKLTLRDPRERDGTTFQYPLKKVAEDGKVDHVSIV